MEKIPTYVLITPARNEAAIHRTDLQSIVAQTARPLKWIIVSDGSTDATTTFVRKYMADNPWIELLRIAGAQGTAFRGEAYAFTRFTSGSKA